MRKIRLFVCALFLGAFGITAGMAQAPDSLFMVGSATPVGWSIDKAIKLTKNQNIYTYDGVLVPGEFKFPFNRNTDWGQNMVMRDTADSTKIYIHTGGAVDDNKWNIYTSGWYHVEINFDDSTISYEPLKLYIVGSATSIGWSIDQALELSQNPDSLYLFTYTGDMVAGEFKFPVNRNTDWGQNMYMKDTTEEAKIYLHKGGGPDDNKWNITEAGNYTVKINIMDMTIEVTNNLPPVVSVAGSQLRNIKLLSNLVTNQLTVMNAGSFNFKVYSLSGAQLQGGYSSSGTISVNNLPNGLFILQLVTGKNQTYTSKFVKR